MHFHKYHGLGNDFVLLDDEQVPDNFTPSQVTSLCDRHRGVGADGVIIISLAPRQGLHARMTIYNPDGSRAEMCGNGLRCLALHLVRHHRLTDPELLVLTGAGVKRCRVDRATDSEAVVTIDMGTVLFRDTQIPEAEPDGRVCLSLPTGEQVWVYPASVGNPHAVMRLETGADLRATTERLGPLIECHPAFPQRTNAEFVIPRDAHSFSVMVFERGAGITQACGSGATAVAGVAVRYWGAPSGVDLTIELPGGALSLAQQPDSTMRMRGPACAVFSGDWSW